jgi:hypothetical protein
MALAHQELLDSGGAVNFWESGWIESALKQWTTRAEPRPG